MSKETVKTTLPFDPCCKEYETHHYEITPEQASYILKKHNKDNRKFSQSHTDNIYNSILRDRWYKDGQPITFNTDGNLTEAQHRLSAIAKFEGQDVRFEIIVTTGVEPDCFSKCQPAKPRRPIDEVQRKYSEVTKSQYAILADILPKHGQKVKIQTIVKEWEIWKKYVLEGDRLIDNEYYGNAENTQQYTSQRKTVGAWAAQSILNRRDSYARKFLELLSNDFQYRYKPNGIMIINQILNLNFNEINFLNSYFISELITGLLLKIFSSELSFSIASNLINIILLFF